MDDWPFLTARIHADGRPATYVSCINLSCHLAPQSLSNAEETLLAAHVDFAFICVSGGSHSTLLKHITLFCMQKIPIHSW